MGVALDEDTAAGRLGRADVALAVGVAATVGMMIVPLPTQLLDVLIATNISLGVVMVLVSTYARGGLSLSVLPTALLLATLYRLALNVSSTRLILLQADAGDVIAAFGHFVVQGNYVVGAVVFAILTLIQFVVIARGAERVAEVGARFSLDAMPGRQLAIDADLRAGVIDAEQARTMRQQLQRESQFYGAMDGAMKFVRGDAIAGLVITVINVVAGVTVGSALGELSIVESLHVYGLLAIGDGLVSQLPALLTSVAAGIVVTRVAPAEAGRSLGGEMARQLLGNARVLWTAAALLLALAVVPGLPAIPFAVLALAAGGLATVAPRDADEAEEAPAVAIGGLEVRLPTGAAAATEARLRAALPELRRQLTMERGLRLPATTVVRHADEHLEIRMHELTEHRARLRTADDADGNTEQIRDAVGAVARRRAEQLVDPQVTRNMLDDLQRLQPARVRDLVPAVVGLPKLTEVLRRLAAEGVSIRPLGEIVDALAMPHDPQEGPGTATERVRSRLGRRLTQGLARDGVLAVHPLDPLVEDAVREGVQGRGEEAYLALAPDLAEDLVAAVAKIDSAGAPTVLITQADTRPHVRALLRDELPEVAVVSYAEIAPELEIDRHAPITP